MRVAALCDIHGNLPALEAVLEDVRRAKVDRIVVGGDVVPGPMPREVIARLRGLERPTHFIRGNGEVAVLEEAAGRAAAAPESVRPVLRWTAQELSAEEKQFLANWPKTLRLEIVSRNPAGPNAASTDGRESEVLFCHGTPRDENEIFTKLTPEERLAPMFAGVSAPIVICGHTHMQFDRMACGIRIVNAGSVGMPFGKAGADWLLLDNESGIELRHTDYDLAAAAERIRASNYIQAEEFAQNYVLNPPSEEQMLSFFERAVAQTSAQNAR